MLTWNVNTKARWSVALAAVCILAGLAGIGSSQVGAQTNAPFGFFDGTDHALCPPLSGYIWDSPKAYGEWDNSANYNNYDGADYGCRTQGSGGSGNPPNDDPPADDPPVDDSSAPFGFFDGTDHALCPPLSGYIWDSPKAYGEWDNSANYNNYDGADYGCRTQSSDWDSSADDPDDGGTGHPRSFDGVTVATPVIKDSSARYSATAAEVMWSRIDGSDIRYEVYLNGAQVSGSPFDALSYYVDYLVGSVGYSFTVVAIDSAGNRSGGANIYFAATDGNDGGDPGDDDRPTLSGEFIEARNPNALPGALFDADPNFSNLTRQFDPNRDGQLVTALQSAGGDSSPIDNEANFRVSCQYSHFAKDDSILAPGRPGGAHLHMFFGNTSANAYTAHNGQQIQNSGGGSCNGYTLNRSAYWIPALLDGAGNALVPYQIVVYYKTKRVNVPGGIQSMPQGLKMVAGVTDSKNVSSFDLVDPNMQSEEPLFWQCGTSGSSSNFDTTIPTDCLAEPHNTDVLNATIRFPQCLKKDFDFDSVTPDQHRLGAPHTMRLTNPFNDRCPSGYDRMPELSVLLYWKIPRDNPGEVRDWHLSSDHKDDDGNVPHPGGTLHADWIGGWDNNIMDNFLVGKCLVPVPDTARPTGLNCGSGVLGDGVNTLVGENLRLGGQHNVGPVVADEVNEPLYRVRRELLPN